MTENEFLKLEIFRLEQILCSKEITIFTLKKAALNLHKEIMQERVKALEVDHLKLQNSIDAEVAKDSKYKVKRDDHIHSIQDRLGMDRSPKLGYNPDTLEVGL